MERITPAACNHTRRDARMFLTFAVASAAAAVIALMVALANRVEGRQITHVDRCKPFAPCQLAAARQAVRVDGVAGRCDLGFIVPGGRGEAVFDLVNSSDRPFRIKKTRSSCTCMRLAEPPTYVAAGQIASIRVQLEAPKKAMHYDERVALWTDDPHRQVILLEVTADVGLPLRIEPARLDAGRLSAGREHVMGIRIHNRGDTAVHLLYATSSSSDCIAGTPRQPIPAGGELTVPIIVSAAGEAGARKVVVTIHTDCPGQRRLRVGVVYTVTGTSGAAAEVAAG